MTFSLSGLSTQDETNPIIRQIAEYIARGWHVVPLKPGTKRPAFPNHTKDDCLGAKSDPKCADGHLGWEARATTDMWRIEQAWNRRRYGVGIACGPSNLLVIDIDQAKKDGAPSGSETIIDLQERFEPLPETYMARTPSGGLHLYYSQPDGVRLGGTASTKLGPSVDTRGWGGQVVAPPTKVKPSRDGTRNTYWPLNPKHEAVPLPGWVVELLRSDSATGKAEPCFCVGAYQARQFGPFRLRASGHRGRASRTLTSHTRPEPQHKP